jgi:hypothetical protein
VLPSKRDGNNRQRMNRQVLPVKQFHVGCVTCNCEDTRHASARLALHIAVDSPDSNCFARSLPVSCPVNLCVNTALRIAAERTYRAKSNPSVRAVAATARVPLSEFAGQRRTISRPKTNVQTLRLGLNRQLQLLPTRPRHSCPDNSSFRKARHSNSAEPQCLAPTHEGDSWTLKF